MNAYKFGAILLAAPTPAVQLSQEEITKEAMKRIHLKSLWKESSWTGDVPCHCPFHEDKTPSMFVHIEKGVYNCFSCGSRGTIASLYRDITGSSLYKDLNIPTDEFSRFATHTAYAPEVEDYSKLDREISINIQGTITKIRESADAVQYLRRRGITFEVADSMQMAYMESGRINGTVYRKRLLLPIYDDGKLISVEGRDVTGNQPTKVLYPKDSSVNTLYDIDKLDLEKPLYVVEGLTDLAVLRTDPYFANSTAIFGAQVTRRQSWLLNQVSNLILIPDNDKAGRNTTRKLTEELDRPFQILDVPKLQDIKDIGDIPTKLHTTVYNLRRRGWGRNTVLSSSRVFH
jgi:DNA primase